MDFKWAIDQLEEGKSVTREDMEDMQFIALTQGVLCIYRVSKNEESFKYSTYYPDSKDIFANDWKLYEPKNKVDKFNEAIKNFQRQWMVY